MLNVALSSADAFTYRYAVISGSSGGCAGAILSLPFSISNFIDTNITSNITYPEGNVTICAQATDSAGNVQSGFATSTWIKDVTPPSTFAITAPTDQISTTSPIITWVTPGADVNQIELNIGKTLDCAPANYVAGTSYTLAGTAVSQALTSTLADGTYYICMYAYDVALNKTGLISRSFEVETDVIHVSWTDSGGIKYGQKNRTSSWTTETVDTGVGTYNPRTSLALDNNDLPYVSYSVNDATSTHMRYRKRTSANTWVATANPVNTAANATMSGVGSFNEIGFSSANNNVLALFFGYDASATPSARQGLIDSNNLALNANGVQIDGANAESFKDMAFAVGTSNSRYGVASLKSGSNWILKIQNLSTGYGGTVSLPANCADAPYVSAFAKNNDNVISLAIACRMSNDNTCRAQYGEATYTGSGPNFFTYSDWIDMGMIKSTSCEVNHLTAADRPVVVYDRVNRIVSAVYRNQSTRQIIRWTSESGSNVAEPVLTGSGDVGFQSIAVDKTGKSYITYLDGAALRWVTNNARVSGTFTGGWTSISNTIESGTGITGVGTIGITGMKGRGNTTNGQ